MINALETFVPLIMTLLVCYVWASFLPNSVQLAFSHCKISRWYQHRKPGSV